MAGVNFRSQFTAFPAISQKPLIFALNRAVSGPIAHSERDNSTSITAIVDTECENSQSVGEER